MLKHSLYFKVWAPCCKSNALYQLGKDTFSLPMRQFGCVITCFKEKLSSRSGALSLMSQAS